MPSKPEAAFEAALQCCDTSSSFLVHVQCGPDSHALEVPRKVALLRRGYLEIWQPYFENAWRQLASNASQSKARFVHEGHVSAIWGACTRAATISPTDRETILVLTWNLAEHILQEHGACVDAVDAYQLDIQWNSNGTYRVSDRLLLRPDTPVGDILASREGRRRFLSSERD